MVALKERLGSLENKVNEKDEYLYFEYRYYGDVGKYPLLKREEEIELAKKVKEGTKYEKIKSESGRLTEVVVSRTKEAEEARHKLINHNLRLVISIANKHLGRGISLRDLIQEGNLGLIRGVDKFDYTKGYKLSTYATWWIMQKIKRAVSERGIVRIPAESLKYALSLLRKAEEMGISFEDLCRKKGMNPESASRLMRALNASRTASMHDYSGEEPDRPYEDKKAVSPYENLGRTQFNEIIKKLHNKRERDILYRRFYKSETLEEVGNHYNISRERVRQIEERALEKLKEIMERSCVRV